MATIISTADRRDTRTATSEPAPKPSGFRSAYRSLVAAFLLYLGIGVGLRWDAAWHGTHPFQSFFSPPHWFIYSMVTFTAIAVTRLGLSNRLRPSFGPGFRLPLVAFELPNAVGLAVGGVAVTGLGGFFDLIWHSRFGLDETGWSFPHATLGWGLTLTLRGLIACRLALRSYRPLHWYS
ncbi:MAG: hypothetical protein ACR2PL_08045, partial [Dehalococcoidia bacterium]